MSDKIILASASPRRKELLEQIGLQFDIIPSNADEIVLPNETPEEHVVRLSIDKATEVAQRSGSNGRWFIGSDTIVLCDDQILGKPQDEKHAAQMLKMLSGREHRVLSGYAILDRKTGAQKAEAVSTKVAFRNLTEDEIARYIATGEPMDKAGSYAIQGLAVCFVAGIEGSYTNVVGLPLCRLTLALEELGVPTFLTV
ncbi:septum formation protein [Malonomonas rubra DSM 5091]|uniref:dTTP/UTP pyrophosphatase n=1 Tax=Malonomonas rubra DSM 5091 TaxID=1122189 RepID=A0A1M6EZL9_MALRU|nr:Maf family protein [Malonomonas rubra]SHI90836.1 septum formation protein [Malonomonas rubra DSM 5091]